jgi:cleavage and polyadenylation specificity factor subunit 1
MSLTAPLFKSQLRVDPLSRCAALGLPNHSIAILPFYQSQAELDSIDLLGDPTTSTTNNNSSSESANASASATRDVPYSPSFILNFALQVDPGILTVIDFVFLPGFNNPTLAVLYQTEQTWTGRLNEFKDTSKLIIFTLDISNQSYPILAKVEGLPHDCMYMVPCTEFLVGGLVVVCGDAVVYVDSTRRVAVPVNGWGARISDLPLLPPVDANNPQVQKQELKLEGSRATFIDDKTLFLILRDGTLYTVEVVAEGKTVTKLVMGTAPLAQTAIPAVIEPIRGEREHGHGTGHFFVGSTVGPSVLLKAAHVEEEYNDEDDGGDGAAGAGEGGKTAVVDQGDTMDWDDDDDGT